MTNVNFFLGSRLIQKNDFLKRSIGPHTVTGKKFFCVFLALMSISHSLFAASQTAVNSRINYELLRFNEDWSVIKDGLPDSDLFDPIKFIALDDSKRFWLSFGGQARLRLEGFDNFNFAQASASRNDDTYFSSRLRLHGDLHLGDHLRLFFEAINAFTPERELPGGKRIIDVDSLAIRNAFLDIVFAFDNSSLTLRVGRQDLLFGSRRLVDPPLWTNTIRPLDGVSAIFKHNVWTVTGFWTRPVS